MSIAFQKTKGEYFRVISDAFEPALDELVDVQEEAGLKEQASDAKELLNLWVELRRLSDAGVFDQDES